MKSAYNAAFAVFDSHHLLQSPKGGSLWGFTFYLSLFSQLAFVALESSRNHTLSMVSVLLFCAIQNLIVLIQKATTEI